MFHVVRVGFLLFSHRFDVNDTAGTRAKSGLCQIDRCQSDRCQSDRSVIKATDLV